MRAIDRGNPVHDRVIDMDRRPLTGAIGPWETVRVGMVVGIKPILEGIPTLRYRRIPLEDNLQSNGKRLNLTYLRRRPKRRKRSSDQRPAEEMHHRGGRAFLPPVNPYRHSHVKPSTVHQIPLSWVPTKQNNEARTNQLPAPNKANSQKECPVNHLLAHRNQTFHPAVARSGHS